MSWQSVPFGDAFEIQLGKMLDHKKNRGEERPYLANRNVQWGNCDVSSLETMRFTEADRAKFELRVGDLLVCEGGEVGRTAVWEGEVSDCYYQKAVHRLRPRMAVEPRFTLHYMRWAADRKLFARLTSATSIAHLTKAKLQRLELPLPPLAEQKRIAKILDAADALRAKRRESLALLDELLRSTFLDMFGDPVTNPKGWPVLASRKLFSVAPRIGTTTPARGRGYLVVRVGELGRLTIALDRCGRVEVTDKDFEKFKLVPGDTVIARAIGSRGHLGKASYFSGHVEPVIIDSHVMRLRPNQDVCDGRWLYSLLASDRGKLLLQRAGGQTAVQFNINAKQASALQIPVPPMPMQRQFVAAAEGIERQAELARAHLAELDNLFASLQHRAFRGEL